MTISNLTAPDVKVRILADIAIIHGRTTFKTSDGSSAGGRYADVWAKRNGQWLAISAHVTRLAA